MADRKLFVTCNFRMVLNFQAGREKKLNDKHRNIAPMAQKDSRRILASSFRLAIRQFFVTWGNDTSTYSDVALKEDRWDMDRKR